MRKFVIILFVLVISNITVNAQIQKGTNMIGGSIYYSSQKLDQTYSGTSQVSEDRQFGVTPSYGKAIKNNLILGADVTYRNSLSKYNNTNGNAAKNQINSFGLGVFTRHYKNLGSSGFYLFLQSRLGVSISKNKPSLIAGTDSTNDFEIGVGLNPGIAYAITPKVHIETGLNNLFYAGYSKDTSGDENTPSSSKSSAFAATIGLGSSTQWTIGVKFLFGR